MRPNESFVGQPVRSLQTMLRVLAEQDGSLPSVVPDGIYGTDTATAVTAFQRRYGLPATGVADQDTWDAIVAVYEPALILVGEAQPIEVILNPNQVIRRGEFHPNLYLAQAMLTVLSQLYGSISRPGITGILDLPTEESLYGFQELSNLPRTGELDKITWKHLALQYPAAATALLLQDNG
jgi:peptidoglycan hydrolase-like protein with peptidoglycan-binding domain